MQAAESYVNERLDHLGIVAGVCEEIGIAAYLDRLAGETKHHVSMGTATVAMILHGLGWSLRRLYLVPQFFANKPVGHLLVPGIQAADLTDDCLGRALDWLYAHDPTQLFAGIATQARKIFGVSALCWLLGTSVQKEGSTLRALCWSHSACRREAAKVESEGIHVIYYVSTFLSLRKGEARVPYSHSYQATASSLLSHASRWYGSLVETALHLPSAWNDHRPCQREV